MPSKLDRPDVDRPDEAVAVWSLVLVCPTSIQSQRKESKGRTRQKGEGGGRGIRGGEEPAEVIDVGAADAADEEDEDDEAK